MKLKHKWRSFWKEVELKVRVMRAAAANLFTGGDIVPTGRLFAIIVRADGTRESLGLIATKVVTTVFVNYIVDGLQASSTDISLFRFHDCGTGVTAEAIGDTALVTQYGGARASGSQSEGASANIYRSIGTISFTSTLAIVEHGLFSIITAGTLCDRSVFAAINVINGDSIEFTYELTVPAGS